MMGIELKNATKHYGEVTALDGVDLCFGENKIYGLLGNNGAGKTTLLNVITGRLFADEGEVLLDGGRMTENDDALGKIFLMTEANLYPENMRVKKAFETAQLFYPSFDRVYAEALAERFGLNIKKKITSLSTGYASIFRLIVGLAANTPYLLLDEPVLGLDAQHRDMFYKQLLEKYAEKPFTVVISTHLIQEAASLIEHVVIIDKGRIIRNMPAEELLDGVYSVSGPAAGVDSYIAGRKVLSSQTIGGLKTACVEEALSTVSGSPREDTAGLEFKRVELQDYFISLMDAMKGAGGR